MSGAPQPGANGFDALPIRHYRPPRLTETPVKTTRRTFVQGMSAATATAAMMPTCALGQPNAPATRIIPSTGETIPAVGLGTWITFNVGDDPVLREECVAVMAAFFEAGGRLIDSSPMYGSSQSVVGHGLARLGESLGADFGRQSLDVLGIQWSGTDRGIASSLGRPPL